eukprot:765428-Hanusia_phi.AAC.1
MLNRRCRVEDVEYEFLLIVEVHSNSSGLFSICDPEVSRGSKGKRKLTISLNRRRSVCKELASGAGELEKKMG